MSTRNEELDRWLQAELEGELGAEDAARLAERFDASEVEAARDEWKGLARMLREDRIEVEPGFRDRVLCALPEPAWSASSRSAWWIPLALAALFAFAASFLLAGSGAFDGIFLGTAVALVDFVQASLLVGAGMIAASWEGVARNVEELVTSLSGFGLVALGILALALNGLLVSLVLRRRATSRARRE